ncbi:MAG: hypothetical protein ABIQ99_08630 [Thermoflexales bacterium]
MASGLVLAALMAALAPSPVALRAQTAASIGPMPATLEIALGQTGVLTVVLDGAQEAYGIDVRGTFDPNVIELVAAAPGSPLAAGGFIKPDFIVRNTIDNTAGTFEWAATQINPSAPASGSGPILIAQVRGKAAGRSTSIEITSVELADRSGTVLPVTRRAGTVKVLGSAGEATAAPPTAIPTSAGGAGATPIPVVTQAAPTPTQNSIVLPGDSTPTLSPISASTGTRAATPAGLSTSTPVAQATRVVLNVTAQPAATAGVPAAPLATIKPVPSPNATLGAPATPGAPATTARPGGLATPGASATPAKVAASLAVTATRAGASVIPTLAPEVIAAAAQSGLAPKAPASQPQYVAAVPGNAKPPTAASAPDPVMGIVLLAIGLAGAYGFGAADRQRRRK